MTVLMQAWLITVGIFMFLMWILPDEIIFFHWLLFALAMIFWFVVSLGLSAWLMSLWVARIEDE